MNRSFSRFIPFLGFTSITVPGGGIYEGYDIEFKGLMAAWLGKCLMIRGTAELKDREPF